MMSSKRRRGTATEAASDYLMLRIKGIILHIVLQLDPISVNDALCEVPNFNKLDRKHCEVQFISNTHCI
jgi:hypothetical protein